MEQGAGGKSQRSSPAVSERERGMIMDKQQILTKILETTDKEMRVLEKLVQEKETELIVADAFRVKVSFSPVDESTFFELEDISTPLIELARKLLNVSEDSSVSDYVTNTMFDIDMPIQERVERLLNIHEQMETI